MSLEPLSSLNIIKKKPVAIVCTANFFVYTIKEPEIQTNQGESAGACQNPPPPYEYCQKLRNDRLYHDCTGLYHKFFDLYRKGTQDTNDSR